MGVYYPYQEFREDLKILVKKIDFEFDAIIAVARGGMIIAQMIGEYFDIRDVFIINSIGYKGDKKLDSIKIFNIPNLDRSKNILIVDDIIDSGQTMKEILNILNKNHSKKVFKTASIFYKKEALYKPDFFVKYTTKWVDFFWSIDLKD